MSLNQYSQQRDHGQANLLDHQENYKKTYGGIKLINFEAIRQIDSREFVSCKAQIPRSWSLLI